MRFGIVYKRGEVVFVRVEFSSGTAFKKRPAIVISPTEYNERDLDMLIVPLSSQLKVIGVLVGESDMTVGALVKPSIARYDKVHVVEQNVVIKRLGKISDEFLERVTARLVAFISGKDDFVEN